MLTARRGANQVKNKPKVCQQNQRPTVIDFRDTNSHANETVIFKPPFYSILLYNCQCAPHAWRHHRSHASLLPCYPTARPGSLNLDLHQMTPISPSVDPPLSVVVGLLRCALRLAAAHDGMQSHSISYGFLRSVEPQITMAILIALIALRSGH